MSRLRLRLSVTAKHDMNVTHMSTNSHMSYTAQCNIDYCKSLAPINVPHLYHSFKCELRSGLRLKLNRHTRLQCRSSLVSMKSEQKLEVSQCYYCPLLLLSQLLSLFLRPLLLWFDCRVHDNVICSLTAGSMTMSSAA